MERQFLPSAAKLTNGFPCRKSHEISGSTFIICKESLLKQPVIKEITKPMNFLTIYLSDSFFYFYCAKQVGVI
jgi:hypothetical protein